MTEFITPSEDVQNDSQFGRREVGITHPDTDGYLRIKDSGVVEIYAGEGLAIVMNPKTGSITFFADTIRFMTSDKNGLKWNKVAFNDKAVRYSEPTFISINETHNKNAIYHGVDYFLQEEEGS